MGRIIGITGIDTGIGKTYVTGLLARVLNNRGIRVITAKAVQTGSSTQIAEDILQHRRLMGIPLQKEDEAGLTCPYSYRLPASPQLAAREEGETIDPSKIASCLTTLAHAWDIVLVEGAGGLLVPLTDRYTFLSFSGVPDPCVSRHFRKVRKYQSYLAHHGNAPSTRYRGTEYFL